MKIFTVDQIREADAYTIRHEPVSSILLMERAAQACVSWIRERHDSSSEFIIICGKGNNGGDGLAIARLLRDRNYKVNVFIIEHTSVSSPDFLHNLERMGANKEVHCIKDISAFNKIFSPKKNTILIDALLGSGLKRPLEGLARDIVRQINISAPHVISIDVPSGLFCDTLNDPNDEVIRARHTLSFMFPKLSFMFPETAEHVGSFSILDIGLHQEYIEHSSTPYYFITKNDAAAILKTRNKAAHKGNFGHSLIIAGSHEKIGAAVLSARGCLRSGTGLLSMHVPKCGYEIMQTAVPEAMAIADQEMNFISDHLSVEKYSAIGIGPGIGTEKQTQNVLKLLIQNTQVPLVMDADAINILAENKTWCSFLPAGSILTPHPKEFERLAGKASNSEERLKMQRDLSIRFKVYIVLKGAHTSLSCPDGNVFFNSSGNPGMAKGGSGDVLTGIITGLMAQHYSSQEAAILGVYLHGLAGDFAASAGSQESMTPSDLIGHMANAFNFLRS